MNISYSVVIQAVEKRKHNVDKMLLKLPKSTIVHYDKKMISPISAFYDMLEYNTMDFRLHLQDDVILPNRFSEYLPYVCKDMKDNEMDLLTLFTPRRKLPKEQLSKGIKYGIFPNYLWLQATIFSANFIDKMRKHKDIYKIDNKSCDLFVQDCLKHNKIKAYCHLPSVVQHNVYMGSVIGNADNELRMSDIYDSNYINKYLDEA